MECNHIHLGRTRSWTPNTKIRMSRAHGLTLQTQKALAGQRQADELGWLGTGEQTRPECLGGGRVRFDVQAHHELGGRHLGWGLVFCGRRRRQLLMAIPACLPGQGWPDGEVGRGSVESRGGVGPPPGADQWGCAARLICAWVRSATARSRKTMCRVWSAGFGGGADRQCCFACSVPDSWSGQQGH
jgi:hypothetical protein